MASENQISCLSLTRHIIATIIGIQGIIFVINFLSFSAKFKLNVFPFVFKYEIKKLLPFCLPQALSANLTCHLKNLLTKNAFNGTALKWSF